MKELNIACFLAAARSLNISVAAQEFRLTQQTVSRNIRSLEEELGCTLLFRRNDGIRLTDAGQRYLTIFTEMDNSLRRLYANFSPGAQERLRVGCSEWSGCPIACMETLRELVQPDSRNWLDLRLLQDRELCRQLSAGELDLAFLTAYALGELAGELLVVPAARLDLYMVSCTDDVPENAVHLAAFCRESSEDEVLQRVQAEYRSLGLPSRPIRILPNLASVYSQLLLGGVTFSPPAMFSNDENRFLRRPLGRMLTLYAAAPVKAIPIVESFMNLIDEGRYAT